MARHLFTALGLAVAALGCAEKRSDLGATSSTTVPDAAAVTVAAPSATPSAMTSAPVAVPVAAPPTAVAAQHVLVAYKGAKGAPKTVTRSKSDAKKRADEVAAKAKAGADFSGLVAEFSDDAAAKERMGSVGKFTRDKMTKPFSDAAFALAVDEVSGAVESDFGFHVIKRNQ